MVDETEDRGFLKRWARRKQQSEIAENPEQSQSQSEVLEETANLPADASADSAVAPAVEEPASAEQVTLTDEDMPPIESLNGESDYSPFLSEGVSKELRNMALKKLFFSGKFGIRDGLDDYDDDFTKFEPLGNTVTSDMKFHQRRKERERLAKLEEEQKALDEQEQADADASKESVTEPDNLEEQEATAHEHDADQDNDQTESEPSPPLQITGAEPGDGDTVAGGKLHRSTPVTEDNNSDFDKGKTT